MRWPVCRTGWRASRTRSPDSRTRSPDSRTGSPDRRSRRSTAADGPEDGPDLPEAGDTFFDDPASLLGQRVTVRGEIDQVLATTDVASAFRIVGEGGEPVAVVSATPRPEVARGDVVEVSGTAVEVDPDTFEADFGVAADALFDRPKTWLAGATGRVAIAAVRIEAIRSSAGD